MNNSRTLLVLATFLAITLCNGKQVSLASDPNDARQSLLVT